MKESLVHLVISVEGASRNLAQPGRAANPVCARAYRRGDIGQQHHTAAEPARGGPKGSRTGPERFAPASDILSFFKSIRHLRVTSAGADVNVRLRRIGIGVINGQRTNRAEEL